MKRLENERFEETGENHGIRQNKKRCFSRKNARSSVKAASYRKGSAYTKSVERYKLERERRRQARLLTEKGYTQRQIAQELGVSTRTVKRDWSKLQSYLKGQIRKEMRKAAEEKSREFERRYEGLTVNDALKLLKRDIKEVADKMRVFKRSSRQ